MVNKVIIVPAITMRMFPEEKRAGTYELLLTSPVRVGEIVLGKFLGGLVTSTWLALVVIPALYLRLRAVSYRVDVTDHVHDAASARA